MNILVIDDEAPILEYLLRKTYRNSLDKTFTFANNYQSAIDLLNQDLFFDFAIVDLNLGDKLGSGMNLLPILQEKEIKSVVITAEPTIEKRDIAFSYGVIGFYSKPYDLSNLDLVFNGVSSSSPAPQKSTGERKPQLRRMQKEAMLLTSSEKLELVETLVEFMDYPELELIQESVNQQLIADKVLSEEYENEPEGEIVYKKIDYRVVRNNGKTFGPYWYLTSTTNGVQKSQIALSQPLKLSMLAGKTLDEQLMMIVLMAKPEFKEIPKFKELSRQKLVELQPRIQQYERARPENPETKLEKQVLRLM
jgi:ActR/RegA family two-component response regulator